MTLLRLDENQVRVVAPDVGGGFGAKFVMYPEEVAVAAAGLMLRRPVKWIEDRREHFLAAIQERDQYWDLEAAFESDGRLLGVRGRMIHDEGAYTPQGINLPYNASTALPGPYMLPAYELDVQVVETNKVATMPVRGAGYPEGAFAMERVLDAIAARARARPRRSAAAQSRAGRQDSLRHAAEDPLRLGDHARQRRLPALPAARARTPSATPSLPSARTARARDGPLSRHRHRQRHEGHRPRAVRIRHRADRPLRPHLGLHRRDADGAGHQDRAGADLRRAVRRAARQRDGDGRRHRGDPARPGRLRQPADHHRRLGGAHGGGGGAREGADGRGASAGGKPARPGNRETASIEVAGHRTGASRCKRWPRRCPACRAMPCRAISSRASKACRTSSRPR